MTTIAIYEGKHYELLATLNINTWEVMVLKPIECSRRILKTKITTAEWGEEIFTFIPASAVDDKDAVITIYKNIANYQMGQAIQQLHEWKTLGGRIS